MSQKSPRLNVDIIHLYLSHYYSPHPPFGVPLALENLLNLFLHKRRNKTASLPSLLRAFERKTKIQSLMTAMYDLKLYPALILLQLNT